MSTFICSTKTFSRIYQGLKTLNQEIENGPYRNYPITATEINDWTFSYDGIEEIIRKLYSLNVRAVKEKYGGQQSEDLSSAEWLAISADTEIPNSGQLLKSLECLFYQMSEGSIPIEDVYNDLGRLIRCLKMEMGENTKDYKLAEWD